MNNPQALVGNELPESSLNWTLRLVTNPETQKSGSEESSVEEACSGALGSVLARASEDGELTSVFVEKVALIEKKKGKGKDAGIRCETLPERLSPAKTEMGFAEYEMKGGQENGEE